MKKKVLSKLFVSLITASLLLSGCGAEETSGNVEGSQVEKEQETTEEIESDDNIADEDIEKNYEELDVDSSVSEVHDDGNALNVSDLSSESIHNKYLKMQELYTMFRKAVVSNNSEEIADGINNGTIKMEGDIAFKYELNEDSEWYTAYGNSTLSEVYLAHGLPDYGVYGMCYCHTGSNKAMVEASSILGMSEDEFKKLTRTFIAQIPLSAHERGNLSGEELIAYILEVLKDTNNCDSDEEIFVDSDVAAAMYGISYDEVLSNYSYDYYGDFVYVGPTDLHPTIVTMTDVYKVYRSAVDECGYSEGIISWLKMSGSDVQAWILKIYIARCESVDWQGISRETADFIVKMGGTLPSHITYESDI